MALAHLGIGIINVARVGCGATRDGSKACYLLTLDMLSIELRLNRHDLAVERDLRELRLW